MTCIRCGKPASHAAEADPVTLAFLNLPPNKTVGPFFAGACGDCAALHNATVKRDKYYGQRRFLARPLQVAR